MVALILPRVRYLTSVRLAAAEQVVADGRPLDRDILAGRPELVAALLPFLNEHERRVLYVGVQADMRLSLVKTVPEGRLNRVPTVLKVVNASTRSPGLASR